MQGGKAGRVYNKCIWLEGGEGGVKGGQSSGEKWKKCERKGVKELKLGASIIYWGGGGGINSIMDINFFNEHFLRIFGQYWPNFGVFLFFFKFFRLIII